MKNYIKHIVKCAIKESKKPYWELENNPRSSKQNEIEASWDGFENTLGDVDGQIPTKISYPNSFEKMYYDQNKYNKEDLLDADPYDDYPNDFTKHDEDLPGWAAMNALDDEHPLTAQYYKQHWTGRTDKDNNLVWNLNFDTTVENVLRKVKNKLYK